MDHDKHCLNEQEETPARFPKEVEHGEKQDCRVGTEDYDEDQNNCGNRSRIDYTLQDHGHHKWWPECSNESALVREFGHDNHTQRTEQRGHHDAYGIFESVIHSVFGPNH